MHVCYLMDHWPRTLWLKTAVFPLGCSKLLFHTFLKKGGSAPPPLTLQRPQPRPLSQTHFRPILSRFLILRIRHGTELTMPLYQRGSRNKDRKYRVTVGNQHHDLWNLFLCLVPSSALVHKCRITWHARHVFRRWDIDSSRGSQQFYRATKIR